MISAHPDDLDAYNQRGGGGDPLSGANVAGKRVRKSNTRYQDSEILAENSDDELEAIQAQPLKNRRTSAWTEEEDEKLLTLAGHGGNIDWNAVADAFPDRALSTLKTRFAKLSKGDEGKAQGQWSKEEDEKMMAALRNQPAGGEHKWNEIANLFPNRSRKATESHGIKLLRKMYGGGDAPATSSTSSVPSNLPWTEDEDQKLLNILRNMASNATVTEYLYQFPGRSEMDLQLRADFLVQRHNSAAAMDEDYYAKDAMETSMEKGKTALWTAEEDDLLEQLVQVLPQGPGKWEHVVQHFPHRTRRGTISHAKRLMVKRNIVPVPPAPKNPPPAAVNENSVDGSGKEVDDNIFKVKTLWTFLEEERLLKLINESDIPRKWDEIASHFPGRSRRAVECHGLKLLRDIAKETRRQQFALEEQKSPSLPTRNFWSQEEEEQLLIAMEQIQGAKRWYEIAKLFPDRSKQAVETHGINLLKFIREKQAAIDGDPVFAVNPLHVPRPLHAAGSDSEVEESGFNVPQAQADSTVTIHPTEGATGEVNSSLEELLTAYRRVKRVVPSRSKAWSAQDDELLRMAMTQVNGNHWSKVAQMVPNKTAQQCLSRWRTLNPNTSHEPWTEEEDEALRAAVAQYTVDGKIKWSKVASMMPNRRDTQCRSRWCYVINPELNLAPWTDEETKTLLIAKHHLGNRWSEIEKRLNGRSVNSLLSRWHSLKRRLEGYIILKLGVDKRQLEQEMEGGYDFERYFRTIPFTEEDADEVIQVMNAGSFVGYKVAKLRAATGTEA